VPTARSARRSVVWAIGLIGVFYLMTIVLGFGAAAVVGSDAVRSSNEAGNTAVPLLAEALGGGSGTTGGAVLFAVVGAVAFATILAVVAGITLASSASVAHDLYATWRRSERRGRRKAAARAAVPRPRPAEAATPGRVAGGVAESGEAELCEPRAQRSEEEMVEDEVRVARWAAVGIGAVSIALSLYAQDQNVAFLVGLAFAVAASANLPVLLYSLFWRRFTAKGAVWSIYGGLVPALLLVVLSPVVSGKPDALFPGVDFHVFPLENPGLVSIPAGFLAGWLGTVLSREPADEGAFAETEVRSLTGAGAV
jgi:cation/acetate symporter